MQGVYKHVFIQGMLVINDHYRACLLLILTE